MARGVVVIGARADPVILVPTRAASLPAGAASTARAIVDMGALVAPGDGRALRCVGLLAGRCAAAVCNRAHFFSDKTQARQTDWKVVALAAALALRGARPGAPCPCC